MLYQLRKSGSNRQPKAPNRIQYLPAKSHAGLCYTFNVNDTKIAIVTDLGRLSNEDCDEAIIKCLELGRASTALLGHLSRENNTPELAYETIKSAMAERGVIVGKDVMLDLTYRNRIGNLYRLK